MNKKTLLLILAEVSLPLIVSAQLIRNTAPIDVPGLVNSIKTFIWIIFGAIVVISFVMTAVLFLTSQGAPEKIKEAKTAAIWGVVGVIVGIVAYSITYLIGNFLT